MRSAARKGWLDKGVYSWKVKDGSWYRRLEVLEKEDEGGDLCYV